MTIILLDCQFWRLIICEGIPSLMIAVSDDNVDFLGAVMTKGPLLAVPECQATMPPATGRTP